MFWALIKTLIFTIVVPGTVTLVVPRWILASRREADLPLAGSFVGIPVLLFGAAIYLWCAWNFATAGRGTPAPIDPPKELVVRGLYRYVRNPMYLGISSILVGEALVFRARVLFEYAAVVFRSFPSLRSLLRGAGAAREIRRIVRTVLSSRAALDSAASEELESGKEPLVVSCEARDANRQNLLQGLEALKGIRLWVGKKEGNMGIVWTILIGFVVGVLAKFLHPGRENMGFVTTTVLGIAGSLAATLIGKAAGWYEPGEGAGFIGSLIGAIVLLVIYGQLKGKTTAA